MQGKPDIGQVQLPVGLWLDAGFLSPKKMDKPLAVHGAKVYADKEDGDWLVIRTINPQEKVTHEIARYQAYEK